MQKSPTAADRRIAARIRLRRITLGMSQGALAEQLGLTFQQVQKYEKGVSRIGAGRLQEIARILGVPVGAFYEDGPEAAARVEPVPPVLPSPSQGVRLFQAFEAIASPQLRRKALELVEAIARIEA